jgi:glycosyltransferase involved in cell wall biosynthesis
MSRNLKVSVVIATFNRADIIPVTLRHLAEQTLHPSEFEVIMVDDGSTDNTEEVVQSIQKKIQYSLKYFKHPNKGICFTQNRGIRAARAPIVCLIADDIFFSPRALETCIESHELHPEPNVAIMGKVLQSPELANISVFLKKWDPFKFRHLKKYSELPYYLFWACNISFKKDFMLEHGMFSETLVTGGGNAHEDVELGYRLSKHGLRILYNEKAFAEHHHVQTLEQIIHKACLRGHSWAKFRRYVDEPEITVRYKVLSIHTLKDYIYTFRHPNNLIGADKNPLLLMLRHIMFSLAFNFITVPILRRLMDLAEKNPILARLMHRELYRGVIAYYFFKTVAKDRKNIKN